MKTVTFNTRHGHHVQGGLCNWHKRYFMSETDFQDDTDERSWDSKLYMYRLEIMWKYNQWCPLNCAVDCKVSSQVALIASDGFLILLQGIFLTPTHFFFSQTYILFLWCQEVENKDWRLDMKAIEDDWRQISDDKTTFPSEINAKKKNMPEGSMQQSVWWSVCQRMENIVHWRSSSSVMFISSEKKKEKKRAVIISFAEDNEALKNTVFKTPEFPGLYWMKFWKHCFLLQFRYWIFWRQVWAERLVYLKRMSLVLMLETMKVLWKGHLMSLVSKVYREGNLNQWHLQFVHYSLYSYCF